MQNKNVWVLDLAISVFIKSEIVELTSFSLLCYREILWLRAALIPRNFQTPSFYVNLFIAFSIGKRFPSHYCYNHIIH